METDWNVYEKNIQMINAAKNNDLTGVILYIKAGAYVHYDNDRAFREAAANCNIDIMNYLYEHGALIDTCARGALHWAKYKDNTEVIEWIEQKLSV